LWSSGHSFGGCVGRPGAFRWPAKESTMSDPQRRAFLAAAGIVSLAALGSATPAAGGDPSFMNNVPDPTLAGKDLPTFKFALEKSDGKVIGNSYGKEATVAQLPISKGIAGVSMRLEPGAMRELHWHATAAEWAFVLEGRVRTTVVDPRGLAETNDFEPGDVWYFPRGHGHMLQCLGDKPCHFILIFDNGYFSEFGTFSITDWVGHTPPALLAKNFGLPETAFATFPKEEVYFARGKPPPAEPSVPLQGWKLPTETHKYRLLAQPPHAIYRGGREWRVDSSRFPIAKTITGVVLDLDPGALRTLHWHPNADEWQYFIAGKGRMTAVATGNKARTMDFQQGDVGYVQKTLLHNIENMGIQTWCSWRCSRATAIKDLSFSEWLAHTPSELVMAHINIDKATFDAIPKDGASVTLLS
jgi:oxalate decarboxylase